MGNCRKSGRAYNFQGKEISYKLMTPFVTVRTRLESLCNQCFLPPSCLNFFPKFLLGILLPTVFLNLFSFFNPYLASPTSRLLVFFCGVSRPDLLNASVVKNFSRVFVKIWWWNTWRFIFSSFISGQSPKGSLVHGLLRCHKMHGGIGTE